MTDFDLRGKVCVVTGSLGLIGRDFCRALAEAGGAVVVTDLDHAACVDRATQLPNAIGHGADITSEDSLVALRDAVLAKHGRIDVLVNNAAINDKFESPAAAARASMMEEYPLALWKKSLEANVTGTFLACQILGSPMAARGSGSIVNLASTYGIVAPDQNLYKKPDGTQPFYKSPAYPTTKAAVLGFTRYLAAYWGKAGVRVNALSPGGVENGQDAYFIENYCARTPLGRMASPRDYAGAIVFLASDASSYMTGANLVVDGGWTTW
ncbi:MAG: SDR family oxidoreductase [Deltaproteobacteria bacterium]|nr:SDR family oxidoreductase [Deltaproteobacteria bacterium]MCW5806409.1 SDR family oxidoreductase [Deltaproteobacteria bacterium]